MSTSAPPADSRNEDGIELHRLVEEQAALRRVATLVAAVRRRRRCSRPLRTRSLRCCSCRRSRFVATTSDGLMTVIAAVERPSGRRCGRERAGRSTASRWSRRCDGPAARLGSRTTRIFPARLPPRARESGLNATAGAPIVVDGSVWGAIGMSSPDAPLPEHARGSARGVHRAGGDRDRQQPGPRASSRGSRRSRRRCGAWRRWLQRARHRQRCSKP